MSPVIFTLTDLRSFSSSSVPSSSENTFPACRFSSLVGLSFPAMPTASPISSKLYPEARRLSGVSSSGSSSPNSISEGEILVKVSSSLSSGTCTGREEASVFLSSKVASSSDSSMPFSEMAASCAGMAAFVRVDAILKRLLPMISGVSSGGVSFAASCFPALPSNARHSPTRLRKKRTSFISMMRS